MDDDEQEPAYVTNKTTSYQVNSQQIEHIATFISQCFGLSTFQTDIAFVDDEEMSDINHRHRSVAKTTDVLSFPQIDWNQPVPLQEADNLSSDTPSENEPPKHLGDIVISPMMAQKNATNIGQTLDRETCFLLVHGFLHLCGYDHQDTKDEELMTATQRILMERIETQMAQQPGWENCMEAIHS